MRLSTLLSLVLPLSLLASASPAPIGANCHGSGYCGTFSDWWHPVAKFLEVALDAVEPGGLLRYGNHTTYHAGGRHIMCRGKDPILGTLCMFLEGDDVPEAGVPMHIIIDRLAYLNNTAHCAECGSIPLNLKEPRKYGRLILNYVILSHCSLQSLCIGVDKKGVARGGVEGPFDGPWGPEGWNPTAGVQ